MVLIGCSEHANFKSLRAFECRCPDCGKATEVFSDELDQKPACAHCGALLNKSHCRVQGDSDQAD